MKQLVFVCTILGTMFGCGMETASYKSLLGLDFDPPQYLAHAFSNSKTLEITYSEDIQLTSKIFFSPEQQFEPRVYDQTVELLFSTQPRPAIKHTMSIEVTDHRGNRNRLHISFYGINADIPELLITEFSSEGSSSNPDRIELFVLRAGNTLGLAVYTAHPKENEPIFIFPEIQVMAGDFIIIHTKPSGAAAEQTETTDKTSSGGRNAHPAAWDAWVSDAPGLSNTSGAIIITDRPDGRIIDVVVYTVKVFDESHRYRGYGRSSDLALLEYLVTEGQWITDQSIIGPDTAVYSEPSTATRSINRRIEGSASTSYSDTNTKTDWYIVPNRGSTFGEPNNPNRYQP